ncbi:MAG: phosphotransferase, partial [Bacteroidota bacterium]
IVVPRSIDSAPVLPQQHAHFKYDNKVFAADDWTKIIAVLDWEMATLGDPLMDLGTSLGYWVNHDDPPIMRELNMSPTYLPGNPTRSEVVVLYEKMSGRKVEHPVFYYVYGLFKLAVIVQQIYARYKLGYTKDPRFAQLIMAVRACAQVGLQAIDRNRLDQLF